MKETVGDCTTIGGFLRFMTRSEKSTVVSESD